MRISSSSPSLIKGGGTPSFRPHQIAIEGWLRNRNRVSRAFSRKSEGSVGSRFHSCVESQKSLQTSSPYSSARSKNASSVFCPDQLRIIFRFASRCRRKNGSRRSRETRLRESSSPQLPPLIAILTPLTRITKNGEVRRSSNLRTAAEP